ncbi:MAG: hypothetical protein HQK65_14980 [Desulfamplus sp.]|nr:hypothetical protein [Desulfamplus sp.]
MKLSLRNNRDKSVNSNEFPDRLMQTKMHEFAEAIKNRMSKVEPVFLRLGNDLQNIYADSGELTDIITRSADTVGSQTEGSLINHIQTVVDDLINELKDCTETIKANTVHMASSTGELEKLCQACNGLTKISRFLNIVGMNIDVESCRSVESKNVFQGFGGEVKELAEKIGVIADHIYSDSKSVQSAQQSGVSTTRSSLEKLSTLSGSAEESVRHAMDKVERLTRMSYSTLDSAVNHSNEIQKQVGDIVMGIQFHDIVRQKLEHVTSAFEDCKRLSTMEEAVQINTDFFENNNTDLNDAKNKKIQSREKQSTGQSRNLHRGHAQAYFILKVQAAQLGHIISELNKVHANLVKAFTGIKDKTDLLMNCVVGSKMDKKEGKDLEHEFDSLSKELKSLSKLHSHGQDMSETMMKSIKNTSSIISGLSKYTDQVNSININLQYKALNAIIMTSKLGVKGRTLEVLAREVRLISLNSNEHMEQILESLKAVTDITSHLKELNENGSGQISGTLSVSLDNTVTRITDTLVKYQESRALSVSMSEQLGKNIDRIRKQVDFIAQWADDIGTVHNQLNVILDKIQPLILSMDKDILVEFQNIEKRYTMESERIVHQQASSVSDENLDEDSTDIELFDSSSESSSDESRSENNQDDEFDDNIELF